MHDYIYSKKLLLAANLYSAFKMLPAEKAPLPHSFNSKGNLLGLLRKRA